MRLALESFIAVFPSSKFLPNKLCQPLHNTYMNSSSDKNIGEFCLIYLPKSKYIEKVGVKTIRAKIVQQAIKTGEDIDQMI